MQNPESNPRTKPFDDELRIALGAYRNERALTLAEVARQLDTNQTQVSKYLGGKPEGDVVGLEDRIRDVLRLAEQRRESQSARLFPTAATKRVADVCETIRKTNDVGLLHGPAGIGKTSGIALYTEKNPTTIAITVTRWSRDVSGVEGLLFAAVNHKGWDGRTPRGAFLASKLSGANRLIIIDNAHRMQSGALEWVFDFHDATDTPIVFVGNPEVLNLIGRSDQMFSRVGYMGAVALSPDPKTERRQREEIARGLLANIAPDLSDDLLEEAVVLVGEQGHARAVKKQLALTKELLESPKIKALGVLEAFRIAGTKLVRGVNGKARKK